MIFLGVTSVKVKALNIRSVPEKLMREVKTESAKRGMSLREFVLDVLGKRVGVEVTAKGEKNEANWTKRGRGKDSGEASTERGRTKDVRVKYEVAGGIPDVRDEEGLRGVRGGISRHGEFEGGSLGVDAGEILRPSSGAQPESGAMGGGVSDHSGNQEKRISVMDRVYRGPAHAEDCACRVCKEARKK
jgi:hypothetical protein